MYVRELISVLVSEDLPDEAWAAAMANPGQVPESQWFQLIEVREKDHPADVIRPYQDLIEIGLERASDNYRYPKAVKTIQRSGAWVAPPFGIDAGGNECGRTAWRASRRSRSEGAGRGHRPCSERLQTPLSVAGVCWLERILDADPRVSLVGVEILRIEESAADLGSAADDHGVPE